ncbi:MAG: hypothetical protein F4Y37_13125 [Caldilineaceae bacterium SB0664_bin_22]|nr:hypothetical protein [Caldilineaceae bacterium SB0664_bin_22]
MPDEYGKLSKEEFEKARTWLDENAYIPCPVCGHPKWQMSTHVVAIIASADTIVNTTDYYPAVLLICTECGYCRLHNTGITGLVTSDRETQEEANDVK